MENDILEEVTLPERRGILGSKSYRNIDGKIVKTTHLTFCDWCGSRLNEDSTVICVGCNRKLCSGTCSIEITARRYCQVCAQQLLPLSVHGFELLTCLLEEVNITKSRELACMTDYAYKSALDELVQAGYVEKKGISFLTDYKVLDLGILAWKTYYNAFSRGGDVAHFMEEVKNHIEELNNHGNKRLDRNNR
jgi:hypothetical protein